MLYWCRNLTKFFCFHPLFLVWCCFTFQDKYLGQKPKLHPSELSVLYLRLKKPFWMHLLVGNVPTVISWHLPLTALFCMSVLCLLKSRCGQSCDDFWRNAITALRTSPPPGITNAISSPKVGYTWQTNKEEKIAGRENPAVPAESWSHFSPFMVLLLQIPLQHWGLQAN